MTNKNQKIIIKTSIFEWSLNNNPTLMDEWDFEANASIDPKVTGFSSGKIVTWKCSFCNNKWTTRIANRTHQNSSCPKCAYRSRTSFPEQSVYFYVKRFFDDSVNSYKEIFDNNMELDIYIPSIKVGIEYDGMKWHNNESTKSRDKKKYELCKNMGIRLIRIREVYNNNNDINHDDCDVCLSNDLNDGNGLKKVIISLLTILNGKDNLPIEVNIGRDRNFIREQYYTSLSQRSLAENAPEIMNYWSSKNGNLTPFMFFYGSKDRIWLLCPECGYEWETIAKTFYKGSRCPCCSNRILRVGYNDLKTKFPELVDDWDYERNEIKPSDVIYSSHKTVHWVCRDCGYRWRSEVRSRTINNSSCVKCGIKNRVNNQRTFNLSEYREKRKGSSKKISDHFIVQNEILKKEWDFDANLFDPFCYTNGSHENVHWICSECGNKWIASIKNRTRGSGCPLCAQIKKGVKLKKKNLIQGVNDLCTLYPLLLKDWDYEDNTLKPNELTSGSVEKVNWKCHICGNKWKASVESRTYGAKCPKCSRSKVLVKCIEKDLVFASYLDASRSFGSNDPTNIRRACSNPDKKAYGYHWIAIKK